jgi:predicted alpha/beta superfamily hydrolase
LISMAAIVEQPSAFSHQVSSSPSKKHCLQDLGL